MKKRNNPITVVGLFGMVVLMVAASRVFTDQGAYGQTVGTCPYQSCIAFSAWDPLSTSPSPCTGAVYAGEVLDVTECTTPCLAEVTPIYWIDGYCVADALFPETECVLADWPEPLPIFAYTSTCSIVTGDQPNCPCELIDLGVQGEDVVVKCTVQQCP